MKRLLTWLASWGPWGLLWLSLVESLGIPNPGGTDFALVAMAATPRAAEPPTGFDGVQADPVLEQAQRVMRASEFSEGGST